MMDLFFMDPEAVPLPPEDTRIREFRLEPWADGRRVRVTLEVDPCQKRPSVDVLIMNSAGEVVAEVSVIESITRVLEFNMHLRLPETAGVYHAQASLYFQTLPETNPGEPAPEEIPERLQVHCLERDFEITS